MKGTRWLRDSLAGRLSLYFGVGTLLILGVLGTVLFVIFERQVQMRDTNELTSKTVAVRQLLNKVEQSTDIDQLIEQVRSTEIGHEDLDIGNRIEDEWVLKPERAIIDHALSHAVDPDIGIGSQMQLRIEERHWAMHHFAQKLSADSEEVLYAVVAIDISETVRLVANLRNVLIIIGFAGAAMIATLTWVATAHALAPLKRVAEEAERVTAPALGQPLSVAKAPIEVRGLVSSINQMLSRLQKSFSSLEQFSADIAHELRTPVNALLTQTQVTLSRERSIEEYRETLHQGLEELNRLKRMVGDMLFIARADRNINTEPFETVDLTSISTQVVEYIELIASENNQSIEIEGELTAPGDPLMLRRAITNLLTNAVRYSRPNACISLILSAESGHAAIKVVNPYDEPLTETEIEHLFDRFARRSSSQVTRDSGLGLGLSIVQSIMRAHGGQATAGHESGQFWVQMRWPMVQTLVNQRTIVD